MEKTNKTRFIHQLHHYGFLNVCWSVDFIISLAVFIVMILDIHLNLGIFKPIDNNYIVTIFAAASTLFAITLAALAIILSFSSSDFMNFLKTNNLLGPLLFQFWLGNASYLLVILLSVVFLIFNLDKFSFRPYFFAFISAVFIYSILSTFYILGAVVRFGYFLMIYDETKRDQ